jgi:hypothetical protein
MASETSCFFKILSGKEDCVIKFSHALFSLLSTHDDLVKQALV